MPDKINSSEWWKRVFGTFEFVDDFMGLDTTHWITTTTDSGTVAEDQDGLNGVVTLTPSDGTVADNDEAYMYTNEVSKYLNGKPISIIARIQYAEAATNVANILFGIGEGFGPANTLVDNGAGPPSDYDGVCLWKGDGQTRWNFETSLGTTQETIVVDQTAGGSTYLCVAVDINPVNSAEIVATLWLDPLGGIGLRQALEYNANYGKAARMAPINSRFSYSSPGEMACCFGIKNGSTTLETLNVDLFGITQKR